MNDIQQSSATTPTEALDQLLELVVLLHDDATQSLAGEGLTLARAGVVWVLHQAGPSTQRALANALKVSPRNITGLVDALVATGFVTRGRHPTDRRATLVSLTERGTGTLAEMDKSHRELAELLFRELSGPRFDAFAAGLGHVLICLREELHAAGHKGR